MILDRKFLLSAVAVLVLLWFGGYFVHGVLLHSEYARLPNLMRPMSDFTTYWPFMLLARVLTALAFTWVYLKGMESGPWLGQGLRYGIAVAVMMLIPSYLIYYVVMPFPLSLVIKQIVFDSILFMILGVAVAWINRAGRTAG